MTNIAFDLDSKQDIDSMISKIVLETPSNVSVEVKQTAASVMDALNLQFGSDPSNVRAMLSFEKLTDMVRTHCRNQYDPEKTVEKQLIISEFGEDIQARYPIKVTREDGQKDTEYQSPEVAPVDGLRQLISTQRKKHKTGLRRMNALEAYIARYR